MNDALLGRFLRVFWINYSTDRAYARKAGYSFGWDWTPRVLTVGIWRPVTLIGEGNGLLGSLRGDTISIAHESATVCLRAKCLHEPTGNVSYRFTVVSPNGENQVQICSTESKVTLTLDEPKLWWTHDLGRPELYTIVCELLVDGQMQDRMERKMGVRTVQMELEDESGAKRFVVCLNGRKLCARGANWVPMSNRPASVRNEMYTQLIECAKAAGMNLLNLWGGGIYEQDVFYDECDRIGILVWQYFMFACGEYPDYDPLFVARGERRDRQSGGSAFLPSLSGDVDWKRRK